MAAHESAKKRHAARTKKLEALALADAPDSKIVKLNSDNFALELAKADVALVCARAPPRTSHARTRNHTGRPASTRAHAPQVLLHQVVRLLQGDGARARGGRQAACAGWRGIALSPLHRRYIASTSPARNRYASAVQLVAKVDADEAAFIIAKCAPAQRDAWRTEQPRWSSAALQCTPPTVLRYGINGYPTLSVFRAAEPHARHYTGARKASAIVTVRRRADRLAPVSARNVAILQRVVATAVATEAPVVAPCNCKQTCKPANQPGLCTAKPKAPLYSERRKQARLTAAAAQHRRSEGGALGWPQPLADPL